MRRLWRLGGVRRRTGWTNLGVRGEGGGGRVAYAYFFGLETHEREERRVLLEALLEMTRGSEASQRANS